MKQRYFLLILFFAGLLIRLPTFTLPLEGRAAVIASVADQLGHSRGWSFGDVPPLQPMLVMMPVASGADATRSLRFIEGLAGAALAPLLVLLALRMGMGIRVARYAGLAMLVHPMLVVHAGGSRPDGTATAILLLIASWSLLMSASDGRRRWAVLLGLGLGIADPAGVLYMAPIITGFAMRERSPIWRNAAITLGLILFFFGPCSVIDLVQTSGSTGSLAPAITWWAVAGLGVLLIGLPIGIHGALKEGAWVGWVLRAWMVAAVVHIALIAVRGVPHSFHWTWDLLGVACLLIPWIVILGMRGLVPFDGRIAAGLRIASLAVGLLLSAALVFSGQMGWMFGSKPHPGARLAQLRTATNAAIDQAGDKGWILCDVAPRFAATECSLADLHGDHFFWSPEISDPEDPSAHIRDLMLFPAAAYKPGIPLVVLARAGTLGETRVLGGGTIYRHEIIDQIGPYVVLHAHKSK